MGITWIPLPTDPSVSGSASAQAGNTQHWMCAVEGESISAEVQTTHTAGVSATVTVTCAGAAGDGITVAPTATGFKVSGTPDIWNKSKADDIFTMTNDKLTKYTGSQGQSKIYTVIVQVDWTWMAGPVPVTSSYPNVYTFIVHNCWKDEMNAVLTKLGK